MKKNHSQKGFTVPELVVVLGMTAILLSFITFNLVRAQQNSSLDSATQQLVSDLKEQQVKAMTGDSESTGAADAYGIYCNNTSYVLFHGTSYNANDSRNFTIALDNGLQFGASRTIIFSRISGEVQGYNTNANTIVISDTRNSSTETIQFNQLGVISNVF